jgi:adenylyl-sulfate kinase
MTAPVASLIHPESVSRTERARQKNQQPCILWFTGLSAAGKSTTACAVDRKLFDLGYHACLLDGDNVRHGLNRDLGFSDADREENIRRIGEVAKLSADAGLIVLTAFISPFLRDRALARTLAGDVAFVEIFMDTPLAVCEQRDPKGLYKKARNGQLPQFTGIDSAYEAPVHPELVLDTSQLDVGACADQVIAYLTRHHYLRQHGS